MDSARRFWWQPLQCLHYSFLPRPLPAGSHHELLFLGVLRVRFTNFFVFLLILCLFILFFLKPPLSLKGHLFFFFFLVFRSFYQEGIYFALHFHGLNLISGSRSSFPCRAQFTVSPEAWGRGPSRRRLILLALSFL